ncbi:pectate lyase [Gilvimarinus sp. SDUM040013]|uniref:Pectate lyase n=1 Tax=Gilvimarinus gilvus TaxID=3058038 RepID=A0ABU4RZ07_9GAMM|nr:pectate lyase [Gilvimarinus sp. SDUM040013]MDO3386627.1 pectate lyase [Gilvimarinus sp. SDUM040013]MDX6849486.1 pectate lyase [Gilvimarinus sp. SDUM040013]
MKAVSLSSALVISALLSACGGGGGPTGSSNGSNNSSSSESSSSSSSSSSESSSSESSSSSSQMSHCDMMNTVVGFASLGDGTTGGAGGDIVTVTTGEELAQAISQKGSNPLTIFVDGTITPENSPGDNFDIKDVDDVSIIGVGDNALLDGIGLYVRRASNIIIRNLTIRYVTIGAKDGISLEGPANNIWIDHNEIYNDLDSDKDFYDELISGKRDVDNITLSYNYLHDSWKTSLWGSSDTDSSHRRVTFYANHWENASSRMPLFRFGEGHILNNLYQGVTSTAINSRMGANIRIEGTVFEDVKNPIVSFYSEEIGYWDVADNLYTDISWSNPSGGDIIAGPGTDLESTVSYTPPYDYTAMPVDEVKQHLLDYAGSGKITECLPSP